MKQETPGREVRESPGFIRGEDAKNHPSTSRVGVSMRVGGGDEHHVGTAEAFSPQAVAGLLREVADYMLARPAVGPFTSHWLQQNPGNPPPSEAEEEAEESTTT
jgi:hypothetical protein